MFKLSLNLRLLLVVGSVLADPCTITIPTDLPDPQPVFIVNDSLFVPTTAVTELEENEEITLICAGSGNKIVSLSQQTVSLVCSGGTTFLDSSTGSSYALADLNCTKIPVADLLVTETSCADGAGLVYEAGFPLNDDFHSVFTICYDTNNERTLYSQSIVNGAAQSFKINESARRAFRAGGMSFTTTATNTLYTNKNQITRFNTLFGSSQTFINTTSFLARGHLAPDADFVFAYEQLATYFYTNCAPEWQVVNAGNWLRVEDAVRKLATTLGSDVLVYTGTLGVLEITNPSTNALTEIYLDKNEVLAAPQYYYKVLLNPDLPIDIVFITVNNPFETFGSEVEFCTNVCDKYGLNSSYYTSSSRGYTFCCELNDFWTNAMETETPYFNLPEGWSYKS